MGGGARMTMATRQTLVEKYAVLYSTLADKLSGGARRFSVRRALQ